MNYKIGDRVYVIPGGNVKHYLCNGYNDSINFFKKIQAGTIVDTLGDEVQIRFDNHTLPIHAWWVNKKVVSADLNHVLNFKNEKFTRFMKRVEARHMKKAGE